MKISPLAVETAKEVAQYFTEQQQANKGRAADGGISLPYIAAIVEAADDGNHVDIGSLFGASAITAAVMKKKLGHEGKVYCIDPYDEETRNATVGVIADDPKTKALLSGTPEALKKNAEAFDVDLILIQKESDPWPKELEDKTFATAYIDGDHKGDAPWNDFENLRGRTFGYIGTDNYEEEYPDVVAAMYKAMDTDDWFLYYKNYIFLALRRIMPNRSDPSGLFYILGT